jgi:hypothetical protein
MITQITRSHHGSSGAADARRIIGLITRNVTVPKVMRSRKGLTRSTLADSAVAYGVLDVATGADPPARGAVRVPTR